MDCENSYLEKLERGELLNKDEFEGLVQRVTSILDSEPNVICTDCPITIVPHIRGDFKALIQYLTISGSPPETKFLFLGSYGNWGAQGVEALSYVLALKDLYPHRIILLRNARDSEDSQIFGFYDVLKKAYDSPKLYKAAIKLFSCLPIAAVIANKIYCGGISQNLTSIERIGGIERRQAFIYDYSEFEEFMTAYPNNEEPGWYLGNVRTNTYGKDVVKKFCCDNGLELIVRSSYTQPFDPAEFDNKMIFLVPGTIMKISIDDNGKIVTKLIEAKVKE